MQITDLTPVGKTKTRVTIDYDRTLVLSNRDVLQFDLRRDREIPEETREELWKKFRRDALRKCGSLLKDMDYTEKSLAGKLAGNGFPEEIVREAVEAMKEAHYVDDRRFAESYLQSHAGSRSRLRLRMDLLNKGISSDLADEILAEWEEENGSRIFEEEVGQIRELLRKRHYDPAAANWQETQKTKAFLMRKGYSSEVIRAALQD